MYSSPESPKSTTSSLGRSTACSVSLRHSVALRGKSSPNGVLLCPRAGVLSLVGNCVLLLVAYHKRSTLKPAEFFIINLSISDLGMTLTLFPLAIPSSFSHRCVTPGEPGAIATPYNTEGRFCSVNATNDQIRMKQSKRHGRFQHIDDRCIGELSRDDEYDVLITVTTNRRNKNVSVDPLGCCRLHLRTIKSLPAHLKLQ